MNGWVNVASVTCKLQRLQHWIKCVLWRSTGGNEQHVGDDDVGIEKSSKNEKP